MAGSACGLHDAAGLALAHVSQAAGANVRPDVQGLRLRPVLSCLRTGFLPEYYPAGADIGSTGRSRLL
jgi:hypothetical protein